MTDVSVGTVVKYLGVIICIGAIIKMSVIGFYGNELPVILGVVAVGVAVTFVGQRIEDG